MKKFLGILITSMLISFNSNAAIVCYGSSQATATCFGSNGSCSGTWAGCGGYPEDGCACFAIMPNNNDNNYILEIYSDVYVFTNKLTLEQTFINSNIIDIEGYNTGFQYTIDPNTKTISFSIYDFNVLEEMNNEDGFVIAENALLTTKRVQYQ